MNESAECLQREKVGWSQLYKVLTVIGGIMLFILGLAMNNLGSISSLSKDVAVITSKVENINENTRDVPVMKSDLNNIKGSIDKINKQFEIIISK